MVMEMKINAPLISWKSTGRSKAITVTWSPEVSDSMEGILRAIDEHGCIQSTDNLAPNAEGKRAEKEA